MKELEQILQNLLSSTNSKAAFIATSDGMTIASVNAKDEDRMAAMTATLMSMGEKFIQDLDLTSVDQMHIKTEKNILVFKEIKKDVVMGVVSGEDTKLGLLLMYLNETVPKLNDALKF